MRHEAFDGGFGQLQQADAEVRPQNSGSLR